MFQMPERSCASKFAAGAAGCLAGGRWNGFAVVFGGMAPPLAAGRVCARPAQVNAKARAKISMESFRWAGIVMVRFLSPSIISERSHSANAVFRCQKAPAFTPCFSAQASLALGRKGWATKNAGKMPALQKPQGPRLLWRQKGRDFHALLPLDNADHRLPDVRCGALGYKAPDNRVMGCLNPAGRRRLRSRPPGERARGARGCRCARPGPERGVLRCARRYFP